MAKEAAENSTVYVGWEKTDSKPMFNGKEIDIDPVHEADLLYMGPNGKIHLDEVKHTARALMDKVRKDPKQFEKIAEWLQKDPLNRASTIKIETDDNLNDLFSTVNLPNGKETTVIGFFSKELEADISLQVGSVKISRVKLQLMSNAYSNLKDPIDYDKLKTLNGIQQTLNIKLP